MSTGWRDDLLFDVKMRGELRYLGALLALVAATFVRSWLDPALGDQVPLGMYLLAAILVAWSAGPGPAAITLGAGWCCGAFFFVSPRYTWGHTGNSFPWIASSTVYFTTGAMGIYFCERARRARQALHESVDPRVLESAQLAAIVRSSDDAIISKNLNGIITTWNAAAERLYGYSAREAIGQPITLLLPSDRHDEEPEIMARIKSGRGVDHYETVRQRKDGGLVPISLTVSPLRGPSGAVIGASKIVRDITASKLAQAALQQSEQQARAALAEAQGASLLKDEFLAVLSHELRTPMTAILGWAQLLRKGMNPEDTKQGIEIIERNARLQARIIEDLLDMSRIMSGKIRLNVQTVNIGQLVEAAVRSVQVAADAKEVAITFVCACDEGRIGEIRGDSNRLQQVFFNLLSNATKFTPRGGTIEVSCRRVESHFEIGVRDTGIGISPQFLPHVFERFRQQDNRTTRQYQGLGLGLAIVKNLVELHGGQVRAASEGEGKGATFTVQLPISAVLSVPSAAVPFSSAASAALEDGEGDGADFDARRRYGAGEAHETQELQGLTVMVTDDEADARELLRKLLERHGAKVVVCGSAQEALERLPRHRPNILLCDIAMPGVDGYGLISKVRSGAPDQGGATPAIALTAFARSEDRMRSMQAGFQMHLTKPVEPKELIASVRRLATAP